MSTQHVIAIDLIEIVQKSPYGNEIVLFHRAMDVETLDTVGHVKESIILLQIAI